LIIRVWCFWLLLFSLSASCVAQGLPPVIFYTDLDSAPATGGEGRRDGAFLCIYGEHFGTTRGKSSVSIGGVEAAAYKLWSDPGDPYTPGHYAKACVQISHLAPAGNAPVRLTTSAGPSNSLPFQVRAGRVYFAGGHASEKDGDGTSDRPWPDVYKCLEKMSPGDVCYLADGTTLQSNGKYGAAIALESSGEAGKPKALVAYPGARVVVDNSRTPGGVRALTNLDPSADVSYWTVAGMVFDSAHMGIQLSRGKGLRLVDNEILCTGDHCYGYDAGLVIGGPGVNVSDVTVLGNRVDNVGCREDKNYQASAHPCAWVPTGKVTISTSGATWKLSQWTSSFGSGYVIEASGQMRRVVSCDPGCRSGKLDAPFSADLPEGTAWKFRFPSPPKFFHNVYFANANSVEFAWNEIDGKAGQACRGLLFHSTGGIDAHDLLVHDNAIHDTVCDCLAFGTVDPGKGPVSAYNNTLYNCGIASAMVKQSSFAGVYVSNDEDCMLNPDRSGQVQFYNNTIFNAGSGGDPGNNNACFALRTSLSRRHGTAGLSLLNNACVQAGVNNQTYVSATGTDASGRPGSSFISGSFNNCYGAEGGCPSELSSSLNADPAFLDARGGNFRLAPKSPLRGVGPTAKASTDQDGRQRGEKSSLGAFQQ